MSPQKLLFSAAACVSLLFCGQAFAKSECVSAGANTACGYDCKTAGANVQCAKTPDGACIAVGAKIFCWDPPHPTHRKAQCISAGINMACGYDCKSAGANVKCANTPDGICTVKGAQINCWDPQPQAQQYRPAPPAQQYRPAAPAQQYRPAAPAQQYRPAPPPARPRPAQQPAAQSECANAGINSACGYDCKTAGINVKCAQTPAGACIAVGVNILCWDPPYRTNRKAECISAGINMACGYDCKAAGINVKCSSNPNGRCIVNGINITCSE